MIKLLNGDCLDKQILDQIPADCDIVFTSLPYNLGNKTSYKGIIGSKTVSDIVKYKGDADRDSKNDWLDFIEKVVKAYLNKAQYFFLNLQKLSANKKDINELLFRLNDKFCDEIILNKGNGIPNGVNKKVMTNVIEYVFIFGNNNSRAVGTKEWRGNVKNCLNTKGNQQNKYSSIHKAIMNQDWPDWIVDNFVKENGTVIDCFGGLFTTGLSCKKYNKNFIGIELDKEYFEKGKERLND